MPRLKWPYELYNIRDRVQNSRTETWKREEIQELFSVSRPSAHDLMRAIGNITNIGGTHFVDRGSIIAFLEAMLAADDTEKAYRERLDSAAPPPDNKPLKVAVPHEYNERLTFDELSHVAPQVEVGPGFVKVTGDAITIIEGYSLFAVALRNDLATFMQMANQGVDLKTKIEAFTKRNTLLV